MDIAEFCARYPKLMHMADANAWPSISEHGLMSTEYLVEHLNLALEHRARLLAKIRPKPCPLSGCVIRDQKPMMGMLRHCLDADITQEQWLRLLNSKVFFSPRCAFPKNDRFERFWKKYSSSPQLILELDSKRFMQRHYKEVSLSHINTGAVRHVSHKRGWSTFVPVEAYQFSKRNDIAEVTVPNRLADIRLFLNRVTIRQPNMDEEIIFEDAD